MKTRPQGGHPWAEIVAGLIFIAIAVIVGPLATNSYGRLLDAVPMPIMMGILILCGLGLIVRGALSLRGR